MPSCKEDTETEDLFSKLFRPPVITATVNGASVSFTWTAVGDGLYMIEVSRDSLLFSTDLQIFEVDGKVEYTVEDLYSMTMYSARVKAISANPEVDDSGYQEITFTTGQENLFYSVADGDIGMSSVLLKWVKGKDVSHIVVSAAGVDDRMVTLSNDDKSAGGKLIGGLNPGTKYTFTIYLGTRLRGTISATTKK
ncbi:MAG: hypothetical protein A2W90_17795 [Bacteroidetes bacterium GWF2_42_66]|nr:MAG: hypothetical protein A2W92_13065 [Bacteroidetes bacterium GWA2_42_15]OFX98107.1 MAG: hypothetical protein A2W89_09285 [Bacteroidetes bacterium GWE2_42_39]OFY42491.1 MAG: hypothetical protein A2W90_17795 [Bacteroidetes bacterium GWF2_42_66]HAZ03794.1 hypothetical protein [Marinilabiliales bacterium]HBL74206.1 hypothetical protein [Prolixibacteraceae bacterium]